MIRTAILSILALSLLLFGDAIHLKNGSSINGVVKKETNSAVVINVGIGTIKVEKSEIAEIDYAGAQGNANLLEKFELRRQQAEVQYEKLKSRPAPRSESDRAIGSDRQQHNSLPQNQDVEEDDYLVLDYDNLVITIYTTDWCPHCEQLRKFLDKYKLPYAEYDVEKTKKGRDDYAAMQGDDIPVILVDSVKLEGFDKEHLLQVLAEQARH
ncbi:MAG: hypothetical protein GF398_20785 [Chitinivibrionales bacterium]|nr:hypothetical protein [Chitinivibrionales bacterium]